jgi:ribosome-binding protein aMBF1 (putative translation factor)
MIAIRLDSLLQLASDVDDSRSPTWQRDGTGWIVRRLRTLGGLTQEQLAERLDCSRTRITWIESARQAVTVEQLEDIAKACGLELTLFVRRAQC